MTQNEDVLSRLATIESIVSRLEYRILGNGQPGELEKLDSRIGRLEEVEDKGRGAFWVIGVLLSILTGTQVIQFFKH